MDYSQLSDEKLVQMAAEDDACEEFLLIKHKPLVLQLARTLYLTYGDKEDLIQEGMIGLYHAIRGFQADSGAKFVTFARTCIQNQMYKAIEAGNRKKDIPLNGYVSIDSEEYEEDRRTGSNENNPEALYIDHENAADLEERLRNRLSGLEKLVFADYIDGLSYVEIAEKLKRDPKSIDNAIQRIKAKTRQVLAEQKQA